MKVSCESLIRATYPETEYFVSVTVDFVARNGNFVSENRGLCCIFQSLIFLSLILSFLVDTRALNNSIPVGL